MLPRGPAGFVHCGNTSLSVRDSGYPCCCCHGVPEGDRQVEKSECLCVGMCECMVCLECFINHVVQSALDAITSVVLYQTLITSTRNSHD